MSECTAFKHVARFYADVPHAKAMGIKEHDREIRRWVARQPPEIQAECQLMLVAAQHWEGPRDQSIPWPVSSPLQN